MFHVSGSQVLAAIRDGGAKSVPTIVRVLRMPTGPSRWKFEKSCSSVTATIKELIKIGVVTLRPKTTVDPMKAKEIRLTEKLTEIQEAFGLSLSKMAECSRYGVLQVAPEFGIPDEKAIVPDVFVIMPFDPALKPIYSDHIKRVAESLELSVGRADDFFTAHAVMRDVWTAIFGCKIVVAECTGRNPNVFYELGVTGPPLTIRGNLGKQVKFEAAVFQRFQGWKTPDRHCTRSNGPQIGWQPKDPKLIGSLVRCLIGLGDR